MSSDVTAARYQLSEAEALDAMQEFLSLHHGHADTPPDLALLLVRKAGEAPADAAVWIDWLICIRKAKGLDATEEAALGDAVASGGWVGREAAARLQQLRTGRGTFPDAD